MKVSKFILFVFMLTGLMGCNRNFNNENQLVNAVIGDISFLETFGTKPTSEISEQLRIRTHLEYVENILRGKDISQLTSEQRVNRKKMIDLLHEYWRAGVFPKNFGYPDQRKPCFIDKEGNICAVGYLVEQTAGRQVAEEINSKYQYDKILEIDDPALAHWIQSSGLTAEECAMIQPTYQPVPPADNITPKYGISSAIIGGVNLSINVINGTQISKGATNNFAPILGLISGAGQITLGAVNYPKEQDLYNGATENQSRRNLSLINIGLGTSTLILSGWNLITSTKPKEKLMSWNIYSFPAPDGDTGLAFSLTKRF